MSDNRRKNPQGPMFGGPRGMGRGFEKPKNFKSTIGKLIKYCKKFIPGIIVALISSAIGTVLLVIGPDKLKELANEISEGLPAMVNGVPVLNSIDMTAVANIAWLLVIFYASAMLLNFLQGFIMATITQKISKNMLL